jgi:hypothetical protein
MNVDIHTAAQQLFSLIQDPTGELGVVGWPDDRHPRIRIFTMVKSSSNKRANRHPGITHNSVSVAARFFCL